MSALQLKCLAALNDLTEPHGEYCVAFDPLQRETGLDRRVVRRSVRALKRKGLAEFHSALWTEDGQPAGAGYCISVDGRNHLREAITDAA